MPEAEDDLVGIADWIAQDNPLRAVSFVEELRAACRRIGNTPRGCPLVLRFEHTGVRRKVHRSYLIFYEIEPKDIAVLRIIHGARDYEALLFPD